MANPQTYSIPMPARIALVHEWLTDWGGSEKVLAAMSQAFPESPDIFALLDSLAEDDRKHLRYATLFTTFLQRLPFARTHFWYYLALMPLAIERLDLREYGLIVSNSHAFAKGVLTSAEQLHISYVHSPMRYAWDLHHEYLAHYGMDRGLKGWLARMLFQRLRQWDRQTANNVDLYVANSANVARRIWRTYRRRSVVLYPPVDTSRFVPAQERDNYYLSVCRLVSYKRVDLIVKAFQQMPERRLLVIGDGPELEKLKAHAGRNIEFLGYQPDAVVAHHMARAKALLFAANEDFGITPVEAQAAGTPVVAFRSGGARETVLDACEFPHGTGVFFDEQTPSALATAVRDYEGLLSDIPPSACRSQAQRFSTEVFDQRFKSVLEFAVGAWDATRHHAETFEREFFDA